MDCVSGSREIRGKIEFGKGKKPGILATDFGNSTKAKWIQSAKVGFYCNKYWIETAELM